MSRDVLLACLALALLLNLAFLGVVMLRPRPGRAPLDDRGRGRSARAWRAEPPRRASASRTLARPSTTARPGARFFVPAPGNGSGPSTAPDPASRADRVGRAGRAAGPGIAVDARPMAPMLATPRTERPRNAPPVAPDAPVARVAPIAPVAPAPQVAAVAPAAPPEPAPAISADAASETGAANPKSRKTRGRRFVLPPLDEDQGRSAAAIEAFLGGEPPPGATTERPQRRRHRARRPTGSPMPRTTMLVWLQGFGELDRVVGPSRASHVSNAFFDSLRRLARTTDDVREVGTGRVRVVIDADDAGASAYVERARASVQPWLELLTVPLRVETGARESTEVFPFGTTRRIVGDR
jgi:hypothetical protein